VRCANKWLAFGGRARPVLNREASRPTLIGLIGGSGVAESNSVMRWLCGVIPIWL